MNFLAILLPYIPQLIQAGIAGIDYVAKIRSAAQQTNEWTPEMEAAFLAGIARRFNLPEWQTDAERNNTP